jgi:CheY-like chemotaxis protein
MGGGMAQRAAVLIVEDDEDIRQATAAFLEGEGYPCLEAANGQEALERLDDLRRPAVVLLDLMMPVMDGVEFLRQANTTGQLMSVSVVIVSASTALMQGRLGAHGLPVVHKPAAPERLLELVRARVSCPEAH